MLGLIFYHAKTNSAMTHVLILSAKMRRLGICGLNEWLWSTLDIDNVFEPVINRGCFPNIASVQLDNRHVAYIIQILGNCAGNKYNEGRFETHLCLSIDVHLALVNGGVLKDVLVI